MIDKALSTYPIGQTLEIALNYYADYWKIKDYNSLEIAQIHRLFVFPKNWALILSEIRAKFELYKLSLEIKDISAKTQTSRRGGFFLFYF